ncbi:MAG TPA: Flp family type IVb pilin [Gemmataceae bacterium]|nr:Flp family type IVb pilin [Gemmataceae bacterium]
MSYLLPRSVTRFLKSEEGVTAVECALMLALVVVICLVALAPVARPADAAPDATVTLEAERN